MPISRLLKLIFITCILRIIFLDIYKVGDLLVLVEVLRASVTKIGGEKLVIGDRLKISKRIHREPLLIERKVSRRWTLFMFVWAGRTTFLEFVKNNFIYRDWVKSRKWKVGN